ncbi:MAG: hypothetical protein R3208_14130 [Ketobacteraceae bacterium]|nr:hypothetical protein [Ketobacteraceae bacterium]
MKTTDGNSPDHSWRLDKHKHGIRVYTRHQPGSYYRAYRAEMTLEGDMAPYLALFEDVSGYRDWMHTTIISELIEQPADDEKHIYMVNRNFPIADRDYYARLKTCRDEQGDIRVHWDLLERPLHGGRIRVEKLNALITMEPLDKRRFRASLQGHFEPGGKVPALLANALVTDMPFHTFLKVRKLAASRPAQQITGC